MSGKQHSSRARCLTERPRVTSPRWAMSGQSPQRPEQQRRLGVLLGAWRGESDLPLHLVNTSPVI